VNWLDARSKISIVGAENILMTEEKKMGERVGNIKQPPIIVYDQCVDQPADSLCRKFQGKFF
jgi:hypothetical protein